MIRGWVVRSWGWVVWGWVRGGLVRFGFVFGVHGFSRVRNISDVSTISIIDMVGDGLDSTIGKSNIVRTGGSITITVFAGTKDGSRVVISYGISEVVGSGHISISRGMVGSGIWGRVVRCWGSSRGSQSGGNEGRDGNDDLKF